MKNAKTKMFNQALSQVPSEPMSSLRGFSYPGPRKLKDIVKLPLLQRESSDKIKSIWSEFHESADSGNAIGTSIGGPEYHELMRRSRKAPFFIYPVFRDATQNFFVLLSQFQDNSCIMTSLEEYQRSPEIASPWVILSMFPELLESGRTDVVLVRVERMHASVSDRDCRNLVELWKRFYVSDETQHKVAEDFNLRPDTFDINKYIQSCKN